LKDEEQHIAFQVYTLQGMYSRKNRLLRFCGRCWHLLLLAGAIMVVWSGHRKVLKAGGYSFVSFALHNLLLLAEADRQIQGKGCRYATAAVRNPHP